MGDFLLILNALSKFVKEKTAGGLPGTWRFLENERGQGPAPPQPQLQIENRG